MSVAVDPWWPLVGLALIQLGDAFACIKPIPPVAACLDDVRFPRRYWWVLPPIKSAAAAGLLLGIWVAPLAILTSSALVLYFVIALAMHIRARDLGRNLFVNCTGMLVLCTAVLGFLLIE